MLTFTVDRFSTFVFAKDIGDGKGDDDDDDDEDEEDEEVGAPVKDNVPKTGNRLPIAAPIAASTSLLAAAVLLKKKED